VLFVGPVGYLYNQIGCDSGSGDRVGCFESRIAGLGAQVGYSFPMGKYEGYLNLKSYGDFAAQNRGSGWSVWLAFSISPPEPAAVPSRPMLHKVEPATRATGFRLKLDAGGTRWAIHGFPVPNRPAAS
jgi:hypothetical protein